MIYFRSDWTDANGVRRAIADVNTNNTSFRRLAALFRRMGIKNDRFFLALSQPDIAGYDPHNLKDTSTELRLKIAHEISINPWYYLREVIRLGAAGGDNIPYAAHRANIAMTWCFYQNIIYIAIQPRQTGKTIGASAIESHVVYFMGPNMEIAMITKDTGLLQANVARLKSIKQGLPPWLIQLSNKDSDNKEGIIHAALNNEYKTYVGNSDPRAADKTGRGLSVPIIHYDEPPWINNFKVIWDAARPAMSAAGENAKKNGQPSTIILTTTAAKTDTAEGAYTYSLVQGAMPFRESLYDMDNYEQVRNIIDNNSVNGMINGTFSYLQLGKTPEWFIEETRTITKEAVDHDFLNLWKSGSDNSILNPDDIKRIKDSEAEPTYTRVTPEGFVISWYLPAETVESLAFKRRKIIWGTDSSENIGKDFTTFVGTDPKTLATVGTFRCNNSRTLSIANFIGFFLCEFVGHIWIPESKSTGPVIIEAVTEILLKNGFNPFKKIFNYIVQKREEERFKRIDLNDMSHFDTAMRKHLGFMTVGQSRNYLFSKILTQAVRLAAANVFDANIVSELTNLRARNGRVDHKPGDHDDSAIAWLLCFWLIFEGKNLHMYGFEDGDIITMDQFDSSGDKVDPRHVFRQKQIREQIKHYEKLLSSTSSSLLKERYSHEVADLREQLDDSMSEEIISLDKLPKSIEETRLFNQKTSGQPSSSSEIGRYTNLLS